MKRVLRAVIDAAWPAIPSRAIPDSASVRNILFVRANFRMGNIVLATALLPVLRHKFPQAQIDCLVGDCTACLLEGLPIGRVHVVSRRFIRTPWRFLALFRRLRRVGYDLAVDGGMGSFSGALYAYLSGARDRLGREETADRFLSVRLRLGPITNVYQTAPAVAHSLGVCAQAWPVYRVSRTESARAREKLGAFGLRIEGQPAPFVGVFPGGHLDKRWPRRLWLELIDRLNRTGVSTVVFLGPEEADCFTDLRAPRFAGVRVVLPGLRQTAGILSHARVLVTPDSGPMHLAAALGVPVVAVVRCGWSRMFVPPGAENRICHGSSVSEVLSALRDHPAWTGLTAESVAEPPGRGPDAPGIEAARMRRRRGASGTG